MLTCVRAVITLNSLGSSGRIAVVLEREWRVSNRHQMDLRIKLAAEFEIISNDLGILRL
jgi:hypothetical protein